MISFKGEASNFPDSSVVKTLHFHCKRHGLIHSWGTKIPHVCHVTKKKRSGKTWSKPLSKISLVNVTHRRQVSEHLLICCVLGIPFEQYYSPPWDKVLSNTHIILHFVTCVCVCVCVCVWFSVSSVLVNQAVPRWLYQHQNPPLLLFSSSSPPVKPLSLYLVFTLCGSRKNVPLRSLASGT